jgi:succinyl-CoA synthetase alpha subunit
VIYQGSQSRFIIVTTAEEETSKHIIGFTGKAATLNAQDTIAYGTNVVGGVSPGNGRREHLGLPVFDIVRQVTHTSDDASDMCIILT